MLKWVCPGAIEQLYHVVVQWSLAVLLTGVFPCTDWFNRPWPSNSSREKLALKGTRIAGSLKFLLTEVV